MTTPPSTSHIVAEVNAEKTTWGGAIASTTASRKNSSAVTYSGTADSAHRPIVRTSSAAACMAFAAVPCGGGKKKITAAPMQIRAVKMEVKRGTMAWSTSTQNEYSRYHRHGLL